MSRKSRIDWAAQQKKAEDEITELQRTGVWVEDSGGSVGERGIAVGLFLVATVILLIIFAAGGGESGAGEPLWTPCGLILAGLLWLL